MDVKELRIGNWVELVVEDGDEMVDSFEPVIRVDAIDYDVFYPDKKEYYINANECMVKPIPLTEEWLVKFGLAVDKWFIDESFKITKDEHYGWEIHTQNATHTKSIAFAYIKYVHQLQNLYFALTGEEL